MMMLKIEPVFAALVLACLPSFVLPDAQGDVLFSLRTSLNSSPNQLKDWNPNQVNPCTWSNVNCDPNNNVVSVTLSNIGFSGILSPKLGALKNLQTLSLEGNGITGEIPEEFGNLTVLSTLNLENNNLTGEIPASLGNLKNLQFLILNNNNLSGTIPESLSSLSSLISLQLGSNALTGQIPERLFNVPKYNFTGNHLNCGVNLPRPCAPDNDGSGPKSKPKLGIIVGVVGGLIILVLLGGLLYFMCKCRHKGKREVFVDVAGEVDRRIAFGQLKRFSWRELQLATDNFSERNVLGQGGFGKVYKGVLSDNTKVAVKRLTDYESPGGDAAFQREVEMISVAVHRNLLRLIGFCTTPTERLLVYPFMQNLSVAYRLREIKPGEPVLDWSTRKQVALGTARGLEYLHEHCNPKIIHRDVKAANVLLDEDFEAVVGDFGLAKLVDVRRTNVTTQVRGTMGHIAPEYLSTGKSSERTDVFGYGIMLLELVTGQRAIDFSRLEEEDDVLLLDHVKKLEREKRLDAIVDSNLNDKEDTTFDKDNEIVDDEDEDELVAWTDAETFDEGDGDEDDLGDLKGPIRSKNELEVLPPIPPVEVTLQPHHQTQPVGVVLSVLGTQVIVEGVKKHNPLNEGSILWITESRSPLGLIDEIFGPVIQPYYVVRYNSESEIPSGIQAGTLISFVPEFADHVLNNKDVYKKGYDASGANDEEISDEAEFSDDEKEAEYRRMQKMSKRGMSNQNAGNKKYNRKKGKNKPGPWNSGQPSPQKAPTGAGQQPPNQHHLHFSPAAPSSSAVSQGLASGTGLVPPFPAPTPPARINATSNGLWTNGTSFQPQNTSFPNGFINNSLPCLPQYNPQYSYQMSIPNRMPFYQQAGAVLPGQQLNAFTGPAYSQGMVGQHGFNQAAFGIGLQGQPIPGQQFNAFAGPMYPQGLVGQLGFNENAFGMGLLGQPTHPMFNAEQGMPSNGLRAEQNHNMPLPVANAGNLDSQQFSRGASSNRGRRPSHRGGRHFGRGRGRQQSR